MSDFAARIGDHILFGVAAISPEAAGRWDRQGNEFLGLAPTHTPRSGFPEQSGGDAALAGKAAGIRIAPARMRCLTTFRCPVVAAKSPLRTGNPARRKLICPPCAQEFRIALKCPQALRLSCWLRSTHLVSRVTGSHVLRCPSPVRFVLTSNVLLS